MKLTREFKAGLIAVAAILLFIFGYSYLEGTNLLKSTRFYYAVYDDVEGLGTSSPVTINGLQVGKVTNISFLDETGDIIVEMGIEKDFQFSKTSFVKIYGGDFIGGKSISIVPDFKNPEIAVSNDTLEGKTEEGLLELVNEKLSPLQDKVEGTVVSIDTLMNGINRILDKKTEDDIKLTIANLSQTMQSLSETANRVNGLLDKNASNITKSVNNFEKTSDNLSKISDSLSTVEYKKMFAEVEETINNLNAVSKKINSEEGSLGLLLKDKSLYNNLDNATRELELLFEDIKENPKRYVHFSLFGKKNQPYQED
ncbi:MlaD family protein [Psychroflexus halocasei]|uniref:Phospholipid/cholesterol/gamma-HCH transport system substrate-binding protein n=1 Tax=Psychroflexus halocasei TaxID=908615 RepID=A0A1H3WYT7_9FLAO|nr:MlaD family protein [Psychroflexus halocasei]SDZ92296.1 phospholipid/cholesterol/gamma-HCH transport system substrate-binding protein [Psychroflexus halocasei]